MLQAHRSEMDALKLRLSEASMQLEESDLQLKQARSESEVVKQENASLQGRVEEVTVWLTQYKAQMMRSDEECNQLRTVYKDAKEEYKQAKDDLLREARRKLEKAQMKDGHHSFTSG